MITSIHVVWKDDIKLLQESNLTARQPRRAPITLYMYLILFNQSHRLEKEGLVNLTENTSPRARCYPLLYGPPSIAYQWVPINPSKSDSCLFGLVNRPLVSSCMHVVVSLSLRWAHCTKFLQICSACRFLKAFHIIFIHLFMFLFIYTFNTFIQQS